MLTLKISRLPRLNLQCVRSPSATRLHLLVRRSLRNLDVTLSQHAVQTLAPTSSLFSLCFFNAERGQRRSLPDCNVTTNIFPNSLFCQIFVMCPTCPASIGLFSLQTRRVTTRSPTESREKHERHGPGTTSFTRKSGYISAYHATGSLTLRCIILPQVGQTVYGTESSPNIPVTQTQFGVMHPPGFWDIQNSSANLSKLRRCRKGSLALTLGYT